MDYGVLKIIHVSCVALSYALFFLRGIWMIHASPLLQRRWVLIVPHVVDTVLLLTAIGLLVVLRVNPLAESWLAAKVGGLLVYIGLGTVALKRGKTRPTRITAWLCAQLVFFYIVAVAIAHRALPW